MQVSYMLLSVVLAMLCLVVSPFKVVPPRVLSPAKSTTRPHKLLLSQLHESLLRKQLQSQPQFDRESRFKAHAVQYDYEPFEASVVSKRLRGEPIRFGKRSPREPIRFGKRFDPMGYADYQ